MGLFDFWGKCSGLIQSRKAISNAIRGEVEALEKRTLLTGTPVYWNPAGGTGTWDTNSVNTPWHTGSPTGPTVAWNNSEDYQAVFPAGNAATISVNADVTAGSIVFADDGYTLTGSHTLTLAGDTSQIDVAWNDTATIDVPIVGTAGLVKSDNGMLILSESNTYTGGIVTVPGLPGGVHACEQAVAGAF